MSTVQSLYDELQFRVDVDADLIHIVNRAVRAIFKRLLYHKSDIIRDEFSLSLYASVEYAASTIALNDANPDTLTDSTNAFVTEGFKSGMLITTDHASNGGPFTLNTVAIGTMTLVSTDALSAVSSGSLITLTSYADRVNLPSDFWGFPTENADDFPYVDGYNYTLKPLPSQKAALVNSEGGIPRWFKVKGQRLHVWPPTGEDITIKGDYFKRPATLTATTDTVPFYELFDDAICDAIAYLYEKGLTTQGENMTLLEKLLREAVDLVVPNYSPKAPVMAGGIEFESFV